jgi:hypothetical protein
LDRRIKAGVFSTVETCTFPEEKIKAQCLSKLYSHKAEFDECSVFWGKLLRADR